MREIRDEVSSEDVYLPWRIMDVAGNANGNYGLILALSAGHFVAAVHIWLPDGFEVRAAISGRFVLVRVRALRAFFAAVGFASGGVAAVRNTGLVLETICEESQA